METERETVKIRTKKGRIVTLSITSKTETHLYGRDKFKLYTIIPINDIDEMLPVKNDE